MLSFSVVFSFVSNHFIIKKIDSFSASLNELISLAETNSAANLQDKTERIVSEWKNSERIIRAFVSYESLSEATINLEMLSELSESGLNDEFEIHCIVAYNHVRKIGENEKINLKNIF